MVQHCTQFLHAASVIPKIIPSNVDVGKEML